MTSKTRVNHFDVLRRLSEQDKDIRFSDQILRLQTTKKGTQVTVGIGGDVVAAVADGKLVGGLFLWDREQFKAALLELEAESK